MVAMILLISWEELAMLSIASLSCLTYSLLVVTWRPASLTLSRASSAEAAVCLELLAISAMVAESSSTALACSVAPCARDWELLETWSAPAETWSADWEILAMVSLMRRTNWLTLSWMGLRSPGKLAVSSTSKLPLAIWLVQPEMSSTTLLRTCWLVRRAPHISPSSFLPSKLTGTDRLPWLKPTSALCTWALGSTMLRMILLAINSTSTVARAIMATMMIRLTLEMMFCCLMMASWASDRASAAFSPASAAAFSLGVHSLTIILAASVWLVLAISIISTASSFHTLMAVSKASRVLLSSRGKIFCRLLKRVSRSSSPLFTVERAVISPERTTSRRFRAAIL